MLLTVTKKVFWGKHDTEKRNFPSTVYKWNGINDTS